MSVKPVQAHFEHEAVRIEPERGVVLAVLRKLARLVDDFGALAHRPVVRLADDGAAVAELLDDNPLGGQLVAVAQLARANRGANAFSDALGSLGLLDRLEVDRAVAR